MSDLRELYQEVILDHTRSPRNFGRLEGSCRRIEGINPICGDHLTVYLEVDGELVSDLRFEGMGCAISTASASLMTETVKGKSTQEARATFEKFHAAITSPSDEALDLEALGKLAVLTGVREFPMRVKCASLAWHALRAALDEGNESVTTE